jgi:hypothetical protein
MAFQYLSQSKRRLGIVLGWCIRSITELIVVGRRSSFQSAFWKPPESFRTSNPSVFGVIAYT